MMPYTHTGPAVFSQTNSMGMSHTYVDPTHLDNFKRHIENHISALTTEVQTIQNHANWIQPRIHEFLKFMTWMEGAHPDIIEAFKKSTEVAQKLDQANNNDMVYAQAESA